MNPQQLIDFLATLGPATRAGITAWRKFDELVQEVKAVAIKSDLALPLSQAEVDHILQVYTPLYNQALTDIELAGDTLGTDVFH